MKLQSREKKFVIGALVALAIFSLLKLVVLPRWDRAQGGPGNLFQVQKELRSDRELIATKQLRDQVNALQSHLNEQSGRLFSASDSSQAGAEFLTWLSSSASQQQLGFVRSEFLPPVPARPKYERIPVRIELVGRITQITQFLSVITSSDHLVSLDDLELSSNGDKEKRVRCSVVASALVIVSK